MRKWISRLNDWRKARWKKSSKTSLQQNFWEALFKGRTLWAVFPSLLYYLSFHWGQSEIVSPGLENTGESTRLRVPVYGFRKSSPALGATPASRVSRKLWRNHRRDSATWGLRNSGSRSGQPCPALPDRMPASYRPWGIPGKPSFWSWIGVNSMPLCMPTRTLAARYFSVIFVEQMDRFLCPFGGNR